MGALLALGEAEERDKPREKGASLSMRLCFSTLLGCVQPGL